MRRIGSIDELKELAGQEVGVSDWFEITQPRIARFADATDDHQWIHVDPERARRESPFGETVAHGFLTLALLPAMMASAVALPPSRLGVNYGVNRVRFPAPVPAGSRLRGRIAVHAVEAAGGGIQVVWAVTVERAGSEKPVCVAEWIMRFYY